MEKQRIVRFSFRQTGFETPTVGHYLVPARSDAEAVEAIRKQRSGIDEAVEVVGHFER